MTDNDLTPREVRIARDAYKLGRRDERWYPVHEADWDAAAAARYPLPTVEVPRVVVDDQCIEWAVIDGKLVWRVRGFSVFNSMGKGDGERMYLSEARVTLLADLLANPTERKEVAE